MISELNRIMDRAVKVWMLALSHYFFVSILLTYTFTDAALLHVRYILGLLLIAYNTHVQILSLVQIKSGYGMEK